MTEASLLTSVRRKFGVVASASEIRVKAGFKFIALSLFDCVLDHKTAYLWALLFPFVKWDQNKPNLMGRDDA